MQAALLGMEYFATYLLSWPFALFSNQAKFAPNAKPPPGGHAKLWLWDSQQKGPGEACWLLVSQHHGCHCIETHTATASPRTQPLIQHLTWFLLHWELLTDPHTQDLIWLYRKDQKRLCLVLYPMPGRIQLGHAFSPKVPGTQSPIHGNKLLSTVGCSKPRNGPNSLTIGQAWTLISLETCKPAVIVMPRKQWPLCSPPSTLATSRPLRQTSVSIWTCIGPSRPPKLETCLLLHNRCLQPVCPIGHPLRIEDCKTLMPIKKALHHCWQSPPCYLNKRDPRHWNAPS